MVENKLIELSRSSFEFSPILQSDLITIIEGFNLKNSPGIDNILWKLAEVPIQTDSKLKNQREGPLLIFKKIF